MRIIDADKLQTDYIEIASGDTDEIELVSKEQIALQPELPTMQSNHKCDYCVNQGGMLVDCFPKYDMKQCAFKGKIVIEVNVC